MKNLHASRGVTGHPCEVCHVDFDVFARIFTAGNSPEMSLSIESVGQIRPSVGYSSNWAMYGFLIRHF